MSKTIHINGNCDLAASDFDVLEVVGSEDSVWVIRKADHRAVKMVLDPSLPAMADDEALRTVVTALDSQPDSIWVRRGMLKGQWLVASGDGWTPIVDIRSGVRQPAWNRTPARLVPVKGLDCITREQFDVLLAG